VAELWFVGGGLGDEKDLSRRAIEVLRGAGTIFAEGYTSRWAAGGLDRLARELGREIHRLDRAALESEMPLRKALEEHPPVALLVVGDPFVATTHVALRIAVERWGHRWRYLPGASVLTAVPSLLGLMHYRFGRTVSLPFPAPGFTPRSPLEGIVRNRAAGLHTLVLLDLRPEEDRWMSANEGLEQLRLLDARTPPEIPPTAEFGVVARAGGEDPRAYFGHREELAHLDFGPPLHALVAAAPTLHFEEEAAVAPFRVGGPRARPEP
jgi:diphthine synthase